MNNDMKMQLLEKQNELLKQLNAKNMANIDYVAMMTDVNIPEEEHNESEI